MFDIHKHLSAQAKRIIHMLVINVVGLLSTGLFYHQHPETTVFLWMNGLFAGFLVVAITAGLATISTIKLINKLDKK